MAANAEIGIKGFMPYGRGFIIDDQTLHSLRADGPDLLGRYLRKYVNGRDLNQKSRNSYVIDLHGLEIEDVRNLYPRTYQYLLENVKPERDQNPMEYRRERWWLFGRPGNQLRSALFELDRYVGTTETSRHRLFQFVSGDTAPDQKVRIVATGRAELLAVMSSRVHVQFALSRGGRQGVGNDPVYSHTTCFDPFPFPPAVDPILAPGDPLHALQERLRELGERLDAFRKDRLAEYPFLTLTGLYNALERLRELENGCDVPPLSDVESDVHQAGLISVLRDIHDDVDRSVLTAYGWEDLIAELVGKPGSTLPSLHKTEAQEHAEEELLNRLVVLNQARVAEEKRGVVRWLRPHYQIPRLGVKAPKPEAEHVGVLDVELPGTGKHPKWPSDGLDQIRVVRDFLAKASAPTHAETVAGAFDGRNTAKRRDRVAEVLETLVATGIARIGEYDRQRSYFLPR